MEDGSRYMSARDEALYYMTINKVTTRLSHIDRQVYLDDVAILAFDILTPSAPITLESNFQEANLEKFLIIKSLREY